MAIDPLNKLCKWRTVLAGWHNGSRSMSEPGTKAMRDLMDKFLITRVEGNAMVALLIKKGVITAHEFTEQCYVEAKHLDKVYETLFPGFHTSEDGVVMEDVAKCQETMRVMGFPP